MQIPPLGHEWALELLEKQLSRGRLSHAYLFTGAAGIGRRTLALRFAQRINCTEPPEAGKACGKCRSCVQTEKMQHVDLSLVQPETAGAMIKVDQIRTLQRSLSLAPYEARYRIGLLLNFDAANASAQNALLKTLEEAPDKVILLLTAISSENLLPTIVSRCEVMRLKPLAVDTLTSALQEQFEVPADQARIIAHYSAGRVGSSLRLAQSEQAETAIAEEEALFFSLLPLNYRQRFAQVDGLIRASDQAGSRAKVAALLQSWIGLWRDVLLLKCRSNADLIHIQEQSRLEELANSLTLAQISGLLSELEQGLLMVEQNVNPRLLLENIFLSFPVLPS